MSARQPRASPFGRPEDLTDTQRLELRDYAETTWNGATIGGAIGTIPSIMSYYWYRNPQKCPQWLSFSRAGHVMAFGIGSVAFGVYLGTLSGMVVKYYRVKKFFREKKNSV